MAHRIAPARVTRASPDRAHLEVIVSPRRQVIHRHRAAVGKEAAALPRAGRAAGGDGGVADFVGFRVGDGRHFHEKLPAVAVVDGENARRVQRHGVRFALVPKFH